MNPSPMGPTPPPLHWRCMVLELYLVEVAMIHFGLGLRCMVDVMMIRFEIGMLQALIRFPGEFGQRICMVSIIQEIGLSGTKRFFMVVRLLWSTVNIHEIVGLQQRTEIYLDKIGLCIWMS